MVRSLLTSLHFERAELCISLVDKAEIHALNKSFRHKDSPTDVLSFPQVSWRSPLSARHHTSPYACMAEGETSQLGDTIILGDLVIALDVAEANAENIGQSLDRELCFLIIHGLLHLCGHDHQQAEEETVMVAEQQHLLAELCSGGDPAPWDACVQRKRQVKKI
jgi:probable rRNA maturation factor